MGTDWASLERPVYTVTQIVERWCELPEGRLKRTACLEWLETVTQPSSIVEVRGRIIIDAIRRGALSCEDERGRDGVVYAAWPDRLITHVDLRRWFEKYRPAERPSFLFFAELAHANDDLASSSSANHPPSEPPPQLIPPGRVGRPSTLEDAVTYAQNLLTSGEETTKLGAAKVAAKQYAVNANSLRTKLAMASKDRQ